MEHTMRHANGLDTDLEILAQQVIGAAIEVHRVLGPGYQESVYEKALSHELALRGVEHVCQAPVGVHYKGRVVGQGRVDLLVGKRIILELKCSNEHPELFQAQLISYLKATDLQLGYVLNFKHALLRYGIQRVVYGRQGADSQSNGSQCSPMPEPV